MDWRTRFIAPGAALVALLGCAIDASAAGPSIDECLKASEAGQRLQGAGQFLHARQSWTTCTATACPVMIRQECAGWIADLDRSLPTIVFVVRNDAGEDVQATRILVDGVPEVVNGRAVPLDPGDHQIVVELGGDARARVEQRIVVNTAEKNRLVVLRVPTAAAPTPSTPSASTQRTVAREPSSALSAPPPLAWVLGGVGMAAIGTSIVLGLSGRGELSDAETAPCAQTRSCDVDIRSSAKAKLVIADVALGIGVVAMAAGVWVWFAAPRPSAMPAVRAALSGSRLVIEGTF